MAIPSTNGSFLEPQNVFQTDQTPSRVTYMQGTAIGTDATGTSLMNAVGTLGSGSIFHLQKAYISIPLYTTTATHNLLLAADTIASFVAAGNFQVDFGDNGLKSKTAGATEAVVQLASSCATATATAMQITAVGYLE